MKHLIMKSFIVNELEFSEPLNEWYINLIKLLIINVINNFNQRFFNLYDIVWSYEMPCKVYIAEAVFSIKFTLRFLSKDPFYWRWRNTFVKVLCFWNFQRTTSLFKFWKTLRYNSPWWLVIIIIVLFFTYFVILVLL